MKGASGVSWPLLPPLPAESKSPSRAIDQPLYGGKRGPNQAGGWLADMGGTVGSSGPLERWWLFPLLRCGWKKGEYCQGRRQPDWTDGKPAEGDSSEIRLIAVDANREETSLRES